MTQKQRTRQQRGFHKESEDHYLSLLWQEWPYEEGLQKKVGRRENQPGGPHQKVHVAEHTEERDSTSYAFMAMLTTVNPIASAWYIDSGASRHFTNK